MPDPESYVNGVLSSPASAEAFLDQEGVDYAVALASEDPAVSSMSPSEEIAEFCKGSKRLIPFANINPNTEARPEKRLDHLVRDWGFRGLKLMPVYSWFYPNESRLYPMYARAQELGIPVLIHTGSSVFPGARLKFGDPLFIDDLAVDFPDLTIIMAHSGRGFWYDRAFFLARLHPNVYMELSGLPPQKLLDYFPEVERIPDKVIFGSDWPGMPYIRRNLEAIRQLPLQPATVEKILGLNAARLLGIC